MSDERISASLSATCVRSFGLILALLAFGLLVARSNFLIDDAYISFRYAANWAQHGVPTFDPSQAPVEGYSNFLWVFILRLFVELGLDLEFSSRALSIACGGLLLVLVHRFLLRELEVTRAVAALGTILLATFPPFVFWCTGGLETALFALLLFGAFSSLITRSSGVRSRFDVVLAGLFAIGLVLVRTEGIAWALVVGFVVLVANRIRADRASSNVGAFLALATVAFVAFLVWRHSVYGAWISNTAAAKSGLSTPVLLRGAKTVAMYFVLLVTPIASLIAAVVAFRERKGALLAASGIFATFLGYNVVVGGDWMPMFRFLAPASAFMALLVAGLLARLGTVRSMIVTTLLVALQLLPAFGESLAPRSLLSALDFRSFRAEYETEFVRWRRAQQNRVGFLQVGEALKQIAKPGDSLTVGAIGAIGYASRMTLHDRNGLVDREVARLESDAAGEGERSAGHDRRVPRAWFLPRKPTYFQALVWPGPFTGDRWPGFQAAAGHMMTMLLRDPGERPLLEHTIAEAHELEPAPGIPPGSYLLVLKRTDDPAKARAFWRR